MAAGPIKRVTQLADADHHEASKPPANADILPNAEQLETYLFYRTAGLSREEALNLLKMEA